MPRNDLHSRQSDAKGYQAQHFEVHVDQRQDGTWVWHVYADELEASGESYQRTIAIQQAAAALGRHA